jgi:hypothetical protein
MNICCWYKKDGTRCRRKAVIRVDAYDVCRQCAEEDVVLSRMISNAVKLDGSN